MLVEQDRSDEGMKGGHKWRSAYRKYARTIEDNAGGRFVMISNEVKA